MGGPAMIEGGGLGVYEPTEIGPFETQVANGVIDIAVDDDAAAVAAAKQYLSYFSGDAEEWSCGDQRRLRHLVPENRSRVYDVRAVIDAHVRRRIGARAPAWLGAGHGHRVGAGGRARRSASSPTIPRISAARSTPTRPTRPPASCSCATRSICPSCSCATRRGSWSAPSTRRRAAVRHVSRMFVTGANLTVPFGTIVLRKAYGLGAQAMAGGSLKAPLFCVSWPTGEFGGMNLEGAVRLGHARELAAIADPDEREQQFQAMVERQYEQGAAVNVAMLFEIDDVIDPADSRTWISTLLTTGERPGRHGKKRPNIDTW